MTGQDDPGGGDEGFLTRWSRRKREQVTEHAAHPALPAVLPTGSADDQPIEDDAALRDPETGQLVDIELVRTLPNVADLQPGADLSNFMKRGVPEALRRDALRAMWLTDPAIRDFVGPALDYAYDYNAPGGAPGYGPLTESDLAQAKDFLANVFSEVKKEPETSADASKTEISDNPSHVQTEDTPVAIRRSDVAVQHAAADDVGTDFSTLAAQPGNTAESPQFGPAAVVHRNINHDPAGVDFDAEARQTRPIKRRGGGARPV